MDPSFPTDEPAPADEAATAPRVPRAIKIAIAVGVLLLLVAVGSLYLALGGSDAPSAIASEPPPVHTPLPLHEPLPAPPVPSSVAASDDTSPLITGAEVVAAVDALRDELSPRLLAMADDLQALKRAVAEVREMAAASRAAYREGVDAHTRQLEALGAALSKERKSRSAKPPFTLKSVYRAGGSDFAEIHSADGSHTLRVGDHHRGWALGSIDPRSRVASFRRGERSHILNVEKPR